MEEIELLKEYLSYDPDTGMLTWRKSPGRKCRQGTEAGSVTRYGGKYYRRIMFREKNYFAHRLAFLLMEGRWPAAQVDHKDGDGTNNKWENLRECLPGQNHQNREATKGTGTYWDKQKDRWRAVIYSEGRHYHLGHFDTQEEAHRAYVMAKKDLHEFQPEPRYI